MTVSGSPDCTTCGGGGMVYPRLPDGRPDYATVVRCDCNDLPGRQVGSSGRDYNPLAPASPPKTVIEALQGIREDIGFLAATMPPIAPYREQGSIPMDEVMERFTDTIGLLGDAIMSSSAPINTYRPMTRYESKSVESSSEKIGPNDAL